MILNRIFDKLQLKIKDRESAACILGEILIGVIKKVDRNNTIIVGIPRGGLIIAEIISRKLSCSLAVVIVKRLRSPYNEELAIGAVSEDGTVYLDECIIQELKISQEYIENEISRQLKEINSLMLLYHQGSNTSFQRSVIDSKNKTVVIVDDGAATGSTIIAAARSIKKNMSPKRLIIALPISPKGTINKLKDEDIDQIEVFTSPQNRRFVSVENYYQKFDQITDSQIIDILERNLK